MAVKNTRFRLILEVCQKLVYGFVIHKRLVLVWGLGAILRPFLKVLYCYKTKKNSRFRLSLEVCQQLVYGFVIHKRLVLVPLEEQGLMLDKFESS